MSVELTRVRYGNVFKTSHDSVQKAAMIAVSDVEDNESRPLLLTETILDKTETKWQNDGFLKGNYVELQRLAGMEVDWED